MNANLLNRYEDTLIKYNISHNKSSRGIGYSSTSISQWRKGEYQGDESSLEAAIEQWIARQDEDRKRRKVPVVMTDQLQSIAEGLRLAHLNQEIALIVADAGTGKTTAARWYMEHNPKSTVYIECFDGLNQRLLINELARQLSLDTWRKSQLALIQEIAETLSARDMVVIFDEADYLKAKTLEFARRIIHDLGESGLVLIGLPKLAYAIQNLKNDHRQLESRIGYFLNRDGLTLKDAGKVFDAMFGDFEVADKRAVLDLAFKTTRRDLRQFKKLLERIPEVLSANDLACINTEVVTAAASMLLKRG